MKLTRSLEISFNSNAGNPRKTFLDLSPEECQKCKRFWLKFKALEWVQVGCLLVLMLLPWFSNRFLVKIPGFVIATLGIAFLISHVWIYALDCPRCSATFSGGLIALLPRVRYPWRCFGCDLSRRELKYIAKHADDLI